MDKELRILVLEDVPDDAVLMERELRRGPWVFSLKRVETREGFANGIKDFAPDLILSDYSLPTFDGLSALGIAKEQCPHIPFIFVTGSMNEETAVECIKAGATNYVLKEHLVRLRPAVEEALERRRLSEEKRRLEEALWTSARQWRATFDALNDPVALLDIERTVLRCNKAMAKLVGKPFNEIIGRNCCTLLHGTSEPTHECPVLGMQETTSRRILLLSRNELWFNVVADPFFDESGRLIGAVHIMNDITEHKKMEEAFRLSEIDARRLARENETIAEIGRIISSTLDIKDVYERFAEEVHKLIPFDRISINAIRSKENESTVLYVAGLDVPGRRSGDIIPLIGSMTERIAGSHDGLLIQVGNKDEMIKAFPGLLTIFDSGLRSLLSVSLISNDVAIGMLHLQSVKLNFYTETDLKLAQRVANQIAGAIANSQLYTERMHAEKEVRRLAQENEIMAEIGKIISSSLNIDEVYDRFTKEVAKLISFDRIMINIIDFENKNTAIAYAAGPDIPGRQTGLFVPLAGTATEECFRKRSTMLIQPDNIEECVVRFPGLIPTFQAGLRSMIFVPLISKDQFIGVLTLRSFKSKAYTDQDVRMTERVANQIAGAIANAQLFAEHQRAEREKASLEEQLHQSQKMEGIGRLAGGIAHDFNNLLTIMKGYSQLSLMELEEDSSLKRNIEEIKSASDRASDLTRQLLAFSRRQIMELMVLDLNTVVRNFEKMLRRVIGEDVDLVMYLGEDLGRIKADPGQIEQVIMNLAVNAKDAMLDGGKLTIETVNLSLDEAYARSHIAVIPGSYVMLSVSDTGVGMSPEVRDRVFEPFFTTKEQGRGTGLGLSTVYGIVKQSGGNIWVYSEPGKGTTFKIYLPRVDEPLEESKEKVFKEDLTRGSETVLIVEDEEEVRKVAMRILSEQGYKVLEASQGVNAFLIAEVHQGPIHLLLTDVVMPKMSGRELAERLSSIRPEIKVLYMSGYTDNAIVHHGILDSNLNYIEKPFTVEGLTRKVREVLDK